MWWLLGFGGAYLGYKLLTTWGQMVHASIAEMSRKIRWHRDLAKKGNRESLAYLKSLDAAVARLEKEGSSTGIRIVTALQLEGLYPPSAI